MGATLGTVAVRAVGGLCGRVSLREVPVSSSSAPVAFESQERLAAYVAHELRAPITLQRTLVEVTLADPGADVAALRAMGEHVLAGCERQQRLIEALLTLCRSRGGLSRHEPIDLAAVTGEAVRAHDLDGLESIVALEPAHVSGHPDLLARLVANLVSNAVQHNRVGGWIEVATGADQGRAVLSIANSGRQIPAGELQRLFQPFQRRASDCPDAAEGLGLGLAIVQAIADAHTAVVSALPRASGGLEIHLSFPPAAECLPDQDEEGS